MTVITTASSAEKLAISKQNGADVCINYKTQNFADEVLRVTNNQGTCTTYLTLLFLLGYNPFCPFNSPGANVIIDFVGGSYWEKNVKSVAVDGCIVLLGMVSV